MVIQTNVPSKNKVRAHLEKTEGDVSSVASIWWVISECVVSGTFEVGFEIESTSVVISELSVEISRILNNLAFGEEEEWCLKAAIKGGVNQQEAEGSCWGSWLQSGKCCCDGWSKLLRTSSELELIAILEWVEESVWLFAENHSATATSAEDTVCCNTSLSIT